MCRSPHPSSGTGDVIGRSERNVISGMNRHTGDRGILRGNDRRIMHRMSDNWLSRNEGTTHGIITVAHRIVRNDQPCVTPSHRPVYHPAENKSGNSVRNRVSAPTMIRSVYECGRHEILAGRCAVAVTLDIPAGFNGG